MFIYVTIHLYNLSFQIHTHAPFLQKIDQRDTFVVTDLPGQKMTNHVRNRMRHCEGVNTMFFVEFSHFWKKRFTHNRSHDWCDSL